MTFNPKWHDQADEMRAGDNISEGAVRLANELETSKRRLRGRVWFFTGTAVTLIGLTLLSTDWFGTGLILANFGFITATIGSELGK